MIFQLNNPGIARGRTRTMGFIFFCGWSGFAENNWLKKPQTLPTLKNLIGFLINVGGFNCLPTGPSTLPIQTFKTSQHCFIMA
ncbi:MAG: hypothetical protein AB7P01_15050 [Bacteroidia bacterium]